jgi:trimeric autotransporter adhesin
VYVLAVQRQQVLETAAVVPAPLARAAELATDIAVAALQQQQQQASNDSALIDGTVAAGGSSSSGGKQHTREVSATASTTSGASGAPQSMEADSDAPASGESLEADDSMEVDSDAAASTLAATASATAAAVAVAAADRGDGDNNSSSSSSSEAVDKPNSQAAELSPSPPANAADTPEQQSERDAHLMDVDGAAIATGTAAAATAGGEHKGGDVPPVAAAGNGNERQEITTAATEAAAATKAATAASSKQTQAPALFGIATVAVGGSSGTNSGSSGTNNGSSDSSARGCVAVEATAVAAAATALSTSEPSHGNVNTRDGGRAVAYSAPDLEVCGCLYTPLKYIHEYVIFLFLCVSVLQPVCLSRTHTHVSIQQRTEPSLLLLYLYSSVYSFLDSGQCMKCSMT